jgi:hypothetical protein
MSDDAVLHSTQARNTLMLVLAGIPFAPFGAITVRSFMSLPFRISYGCENFVNNTPLGFASRLRSSHIHR